MHKSGAGLLWFLVFGAYSGSYPIVERALIPSKCKAPLPNPEDYSVNSMRRWKAAQGCVQRVMHFTHPLQGRRELVFIDGRVESQCRWALQHPQAIVVLVHGKPFQTMQKHNMRVWVDYHDKLSRTFGVYMLPSRVVVQGTSAHIEEGICGSFAC